MDNINRVFPVVIPIVMILSGYLIARQLSTMQNVPLISMVFVQCKWLTSIVMGIFINGVFFSIAFLDTKFSPWNILDFIIMVLIASASFYFGVTFGWRRPPSANKNINLSNQTQINALPDNIVVDNTFNSVKITINSQKRWGRFAMELFRLAVIGLGFAYLGLMAILALQNYIPESMNILFGIVMGGLVLYIVYMKFQEALECIFDKEIIEIDNLSVKIEKYGLGFKSREEYSADNIKKTTALFSFGGTNMTIKRSPFVNSNMPAFILSHKRGLKWHSMFGRAVDLVDAQNILETVYRKFPKYKG